MNFLSVHNVLTRPHKKNASGLNLYRLKNARLALNNGFPNRWIGSGGPVLWLPSSPDETSMDIYSFIATLKNTYRNILRN